MGVRSPRAARPGPVVKRPRRLAVAVLAVTVAGLAACGSGGADDAASTTPGVVGPPAPTTLPIWIPPALGIAGEDALVEVVSQDLRLRGLRFAVNEAQGTVTLEDGRVLVLESIARAAAEADPTTWPDLVARAFDALLAP